MNFAILSQLEGVKEVSRPWLMQVAETLEYQLSVHHASMWNSGPVRVRAFDDWREIPEDHWPVLIVDKVASPEGVFGVHGVTASGRPYGSIEWRGSLDLLSATLSHELLEMKSNPYCNTWMQMPSGEMQALEVCDRVSEDYYVLAGITVSNFLGPNAFRDGPGPYDWLRLLTRYDEVRPGGYAIRGEK